MHQHTVELEVYGDYALFTDPVTRVGGEKCSYQVPTYEALRGILSSVYWKPTFKWYIDEVRIMNQIRMECRGIRPIHYQDAGNDLSYYTYLADVRYQVRAHFEWNMYRPDLAGDRSTGKHMEVLRTALERGGRRDIFLGTRDCQALAEPCVFGNGRGYYDDSGMKDFGIMLHGITYPEDNAMPGRMGQMRVRMWDAVMEDGVIRFPRPDECKMVKDIRKAKAMDVCEEVV